MSTSFHVVNARKRHEEMNDEDNLESTSDRSAPEEGGHLPRTHSAMIAFVASAAVTLVELRHGGHIIMEPFSDVTHPTDFLLSLQALPDGALTGWVTWVGVISVTVASGLRAGYLWISGIVNQRGDRDDYGRTNHR